MVKKLNIAVIGLGHRASYLVSLLDKVYPNFNLKCVVDPNLSYAKWNLDKLGITNHNPKYYANIDPFLKYSDSIDGILIGSPCNLHAPNAVKVAAAGLPVFLEKPVATTFDQISELRQSYHGREDSVVVSFPLSASPLFKEVENQISIKDIGIINQVQAYNNVPYGALYYAYASYRDYSVSGGLWLQKATHDFDYINKILGKPVFITAMMNRNVYGGELPNDLWCSQCSLIETCHESPERFQRTGNTLADMGDHQCVWGNGIQYQDTGSALIMFKSGAHANYSQNFVSRLDAATRGAIITGYKATVSFDWYSNKIKVMDHFTKTTEEIVIDADSDGHHGGDGKLLRNFVDVCLGKDTSNTDLSSGLLSAAMCLSAKKAAHEQKYVPIADLNSDRFPVPEYLMQATPTNLEPIS